LPEHFEVEVHYKEHAVAERVSWFPGIERKTDNIVVFRNESFFEVMRTIRWII
jgi:D-aminopeptidase